LVNVFGSLFFPVNFYAVLEITRIIGIAIIAISLPLLWWRFRHTDREALIGIAWVMLVVVLFVPSALPWYYTLPLALVAPMGTNPQGDRRDRRAVDVDHGDLEARRCTRHVLVDPCAAGHGMRCGGVVFALQGARLYGATTASRQYAIACARRTTSRA